MTFCSIEVGVHVCRGKVGSKIHVWLLIVNNIKFKL